MLEIAANSEGTGPQAIAEVRTDVRTTREMLWTSMNCFRSRPIPRAIATAAALPR